MDIHWRHTWEVAAVDRLVRYRTSFGGVRMNDPDDDTPITKVLQRCRCGDARTITLDGHWTLEQVRGGA